MAHQKRDHFRLEYPIPDRPTLVVNGALFAVLDLSERGVRYACDRTYLPPMGVAVSGTIRFRDGKTVDVVGTVLRHDPQQGFCVLLLTKGVPLPKMMEEQRYLLQKYKK